MIKLYCKKNNDTGHQIGSICWTKRHYSCCIYRVTLTSCYDKQSFVLVKFSICVISLVLPSDESAHINTELIDGVIRSDVFFLFTSPFVKYSSDRRKHENHQL